MTWRAAELFFGNDKKRSSCEGQGLGKKNLQQVQGHSSQRGGADSVREHQAQATSGIVSR
jgi:hypothetical protein